MKLLALTLCALVASISGAPNPYDDSRILGGDLVSDPAVSYYVVAIADKTKGEHACSGWIYSDTRIVTSASCVAGKAPTDLTVTVGMTSQLRPNPNQADYAPTAITPHPSFNNATLENNIALLTVPAMNFSNFVYYVYYDELDTTITPLTLMGWGATTEGGLASLRLRKGDLALKANSECVTYYGTLGYSSNYMICAGSPTSATTPVSPCQYDEGSPLTQVWGKDTIVVGMYSRNLGCSGTPPPPSVFVRISSYFSWLKANAGAQALPTTTGPTTIPTAPCDPAAGCVTPASTAAPGK